MALDIQRSSAAMERTDTTLVLSRGIGRTVKYSFGRQSLKRNDVDLTPQRTKLFHVKVADLPKGAGLSRLFHVKLFAQSKWTSYETEIVAMIAQSSKAGF
jgi:hypothetical protein